MFYKDICPFVQREREVISAGLKPDIIREKHETQGSEDIRGSSTFYPFEFVTCNYRYHVNVRLKIKSFINNDETPSYIPSHTTCVRLTIVMKPTEITKQITIERMEIKLIRTYVGKIKEISLLYNCNSSRCKNCECLNSMLNYYKKQKKIENRTFYAYS